MTKPKIKENIPVLSFKDLVEVKKLIALAGFEEDMEPNYEPQLKETLPSQAFTRYLEMLRSYLRRLALKKAGFHYTHPIHPECAGLVTHVFSVDSIVVGRDLENEKIFEGPINECPLPVKEALEMHPYKEWYSVCCWDLGEFQNIRQNITSNGCLLLGKPFVFLFPDELEELKKQGSVTVQKYGHFGWQLGLMESEFMGFTVKKSRFYKTWAHMLD